MKTVACGTVGMMDYGKTPAEPTYECGLRIFRNPCEFQATTQRLSPQYGKVGKMYNTLCWLKILPVRMHFYVKFLQLHFYFFAGFFQTGEFHKLSRRGISSRISVNKRYYTFYSSPLFHTASSDMVLWVHGDSWKFCANSHKWARLYFCLSPSSPWEKRSWKVARKMAKKRIYWWVSPVATFRVKP